VTIIETLSIAGAKAGIKNTRLEFNAPIISAARLMNKRKGKFEPIQTNPLTWINTDFSKWICYPVKVAHDVVLVYFCEKFFELPLSNA